MARFVKQLRRVQAFKQAMQCPSASPAACAAPPGFRPSFQVWGLQRPSQEVGDCFAFPSQPPSFAEAAHIFEVLQRNVTSMERQLQSTMRFSAKLLRQQKPSILFRDLKGEGPLPVETLVEGPRVVVDVVSPLEGSATLANDVQWLPDVPFLWDDKPLEVHHAEADCLFGNADSLGPGSVVKQHAVWAPCLISAGPLLLSASNAGLRRITCPPADWIRFPTVVAAFPPITVEMRRAVVRAKPARARGPDGVNRQDLLNLSGCLRCMPEPRGLGLGRSR